MKVLESLFWMVVGYLAFAVLMACGLLVDFFRWTRGYFESHWVSCCLCGSSELAEASQDGVFVCVECNRKGLG